MAKNKFYRENAGDRIWWVFNDTDEGKYEFTFDRRKIFNLFRDYPYQLTREEKAQFDRENPYWAWFFRDRKVRYDA